MTIASIDFGSLYREHLAAAHRKPKSADDWDRRATEMGRKMHASDYTNAFIRRMDLTGAQTLLDVGCGPGTICLPVANRLQHVIGMDFSQGMLDALRVKARTLKHSNVETLRLAWEDDWSVVPVCDIVVASRSIIVADMAEALHKLDNKARQRVYLTHVVGGNFLDPVILEIMGRSIPTIPDYIYILNILYQMGIHPRLDYIEQPGRLAGTASYDDLIRRVTWSLGELNNDERSRLRVWYERSVSTGDISWTPMRWAFISWEATTHRSTGL